MKYLAALCLLILFACGHDRQQKTAELTSEQNKLKDSTNTIREQIGNYLQKNDSAGATAEGKRLEAVFVRLTAIQNSLDSLEKTKQ